MNDSSNYNLNSLIDNIYQNLKELNTNNKKLIIDRPDVQNANKKTFIGNFRSICQKLKRKEDDVRKFFEDEANAKVTIDQNGALIISGIINQIGIQKILTNYIKDYVTCKECNSYDTLIMKENRIIFLKCNKCLSKKAIN